VLRHARVSPVVVAGQPGGHLAERFGFQVAEPGVDPTRQEPVCSSDHRPRPVHRTLAIAVVVAYHALALIRKVLGRLRSRS
jgi:hypothetical protein